MDKNAALEVLSRFKKGVESRGIRVDKLILFGSYATGAHREESDIDVVVISKDFAGKDFWERTELLSDIIYELFEPIEAVALTHEEWEKREMGIVECARGGEIIYS